MPAQNYRGGETIASRRGRGERADSCKSFLLRAFVAGLAVGLSVFFPGSAVGFFSNNNIFESGLPGTMKIALTFDDGPGPYTATLLDYLKEHQVRASFFLVGDHARHYPALLQRMSAEGDVLGNHSETHRALSASLVRSDPEQVIAQIASPERIIQSFRREGARAYFRAPYGIWNAEDAALANADPALRKYIGPIFWDVGGEITYNASGRLRSVADWQCWEQHWSVESCARGYLDEIHHKRGGIVILHDLNSKTIEMVKLFLPELMAEGYQFITLDEVHAFDKYVVPQEPAYVASRDGIRTQPFDLSLSVVPFQSTTTVLSAPSKYVAESPVEPRGVKARVLTGMVTAVFDTGTIRVSGSIIRLDGIDPTTPAAATQFYRWIKLAGRMVNCEEQRSTNTYTCVTGQGIDIAEAALVYGEARTNQLASGRYRQRESEAISAHRGVWDNRKRV